MWYCIKRLLKSNWIMLYFFTLSLVIVTSWKKLIKFARHDLPLANSGWLSKQPVLAKCAPILSLSSKCRLLHKYRDYKAVLKWWREGWTLLWDCKAGSGWGWGAYWGRRGNLVTPQVWTKECKRWLKKAGGCFSSAAAWYCMERAEQGRKQEVWCSRAGLCHRALEGGGRARRLLQCCCTKTEPLSRDVGDQGGSWAAAAQGWVAEQCRL